MCLYVSLSVLYVCLTCFICMPSLHALYVCLTYMHTYLCLIYIIADLLVGVRVDGVIGDFALLVCLICMPYMYALYVCLICMPYMYALYVCLTCMSYVYTHKCMPYIHHGRLTFLLECGLMMWSGILPYLYALYVCLEYICTYVCFVYILADLLVGVWVDDVIRNLDLCAHEML